ncbi:hypothetical protein ABIA16_001956 [Sinorhizobium fredii]
MPMRLITAIDRAFVATAKEAEIPFTETEVYKRQRCLGDVAFAPIGNGKAPADFDCAVGQMRLKMGAGQPTEADRHVAVAQRKREEAEARLGDGAGHCGRTAHRPPPGHVETEKIPSPSDRC